ncbi:MAG: hypothetical protein V1835_01785, partial [Candidatus Micrarchaeota archaeon]
NNHQRWTRRVLEIAKAADIVYSGNWLVQHLLKGKFEVRKMGSSVKISATEIRGMIHERDPAWKKFVPAEIRIYLDKHGLLKYV